MPLYAVWLIIGANREQLHFGEDRCDGYAFPLPEDSRSTVRTNGSLADLNLGYISRLNLYSGEVGALKVSRAQWPAIRNMRFDVDVLSPAPRKPRVNQEGRTDSNCS